MRRPRNSATATHARSIRSRGNEDLYRERDHGKTSLQIGQLWKDDPIVEAMGCIDECCSTMEDLLPEVQTTLIAIAQAISGSGAWPALDTRELERQMDEMDIDIAQAYTSFPASKHNAARNACRRLERALTPLFRDGKVPKQAFAYVNRLSDLLFCLAVRGAAQNQ